MFLQTLPALHLIFESDLSVHSSSRYAVRLFFVLLGSNSRNIDNFLLGFGTIIGGSHIAAEILITPQRPVMIWEIRDLLVSPIPLHHHSRIHRCNQRAF